MFLDDAIIDDHCRDLILKSELFKLFHYETENKLFIKFQETMDEYNCALVFDIKNQRFYVKKDIVRLNEELGHEYDINIAANGDKFYGVLTIRKHDPDDDEVPEDETNTTVWDEIRTFKFENETLVDTGLLCRSDEERFRLLNSENEVCYFPWVTSNVFVQNVKLN